MHPAPSLAELLQSDDPRAQPHQQQQQQHQHQEQESNLSLEQHQIEQAQAGLAQATETHSSLRINSPPIRKDTASSIDTVATDVSTVTNGTDDSTSTTYSVESSQSIFSVKDGAEVSGGRRASRRRTGPLSSAQREKAALIRKLGACSDCRRRRVACHPNHHNMTWEDAIRKYQTAHSSMHELAPLAGRPLSPASGLGHGYLHNPEDMDLDSTPTPPPPPPPPPAQSTSGRALLSDSRIRTPLPSGPRMPMPPLAAAPPSITTLPNIDFIKSELDTAASRYLSGPHTGRYSAVGVLLIRWQDDEESEVLAAIEELRAVLQEYSFSLKTVEIPASSSGICKNSQRRLSREINDFTEDRDSRDVLKIVYYNGSTHLDDGEMVLASPHDRERSSVIRWSGIEEFLEGARSDTLVIFDAIYHASSRMTRREGVLEVIAASAFEDQFRVLGRNTFTRILAQQLRLRGAQRVSNPLSAAELYTKILSAYSKVAQEKRSRDQLSNMPIPLHLQMSGNSRLPSITLYPLPVGRPQTPGFSPEGFGGYQLTLSVRLSDQSLDTDSWGEWLRMMPEGVKDVKVAGPYNTFR